MITEQDLQEAIAECQGERNPNANTCIKLAAFYTIRNELFGAEPAAMPQSGYSFAPSPTAQISYSGDTEFAEVVDGKDVEFVLPIIDELMATLQVLHPRLYDGVLRQLEG